MTLYATDAIGDAWEATRSFLTPVEWRRWLKLAFVVFFVGGPGGGLGNLNNFDVPAGAGEPGAPPEIPTGGDLTPDAVAGLIGILIVVVLVVLVLAVVFGVIGAIMEFVFVESLRTGEVRIRRYWSRHWGRGLRLFGFRFVVGLVSLIAAGLSLAAVLGPIVFGAPEGAIVGLIAFLPVLLALTVLTGLINGFTTVFVVPIMIRAECGVLAGWRRLWATMQGQYKEFGAYAVLGVVLGLVGGILIGVVAVILGVLLAIPFLIVGAVGFVLFSLESTVGAVVLGIVAILFGLGLLVVVSLVQVPVVTYLRYFALLVLGDANPEFDLIPDRRRAIREDGSEPA